MLLPLVQDLAPFLVGGHAGELALPTVSHILQAQLHVKAACALAELQYLGLGPIYTIARRTRMHAVPLGVGRLCNRL